MSERDVVDPTGAPVTLTSAKAQLLAAAQKEAEKRKSKSDEVAEKYGIPILDEARLATVLTRSQALDHLNFELADSELHGEWVRIDEMEIHRKETLGFIVARKDMAKTRFSHDDGTNRVVLGDCCLMVTTKKNMEIINKVRDQMFKATHNPSKKVKEENQFDNEVKETTGGVIGTFNEGLTENVDATRIAQALSNG